MSKIISRFKKVWSTLSWFDWLVGVLVIIVISSLLYFRLSKRAEWIQVRIDVVHDEWWWTSHPPGFWYPMGLSEGQGAYNVFGEKVAEIVKLQTFETGGNKRRVLAAIKLKASFDQKRQAWIYNFQPLQVGQNIAFTFGQNALEGLVVGVGGEKKPDYEEKEIRVRMSGVRPWVAETYKTGLEAADSEGRVMAEVTDVVIVPTSYYEFSDIRGIKIRVVDNDFRDVTMDLMIKAQEVNGKYYYLDDAAIKVGEKIWIYFNETVVRDAEIVDILQ